MSILIVDDEADIRESLSAVLKTAGYDVVSAASGKEALEHIGRDTYSLLLVDLSMPGMSGEELIEILWKRDSRPNILAITALAPWQTAGLLVKGIGYLRKPVDIDLLLGAIKTQLRKENKNEIKTSG